MRRRPPHAIAKMPASANHPQHRQVVSIDNKITAGIATWWVEGSCMLRFRMGLQGSDPVNELGVVPAKATALEKHAAIAHNPCIDSLSCSLVGVKEGPSLCTGTVPWARAGASEPLQGGPFFRETKGAVEVFQPVATTGAGTKKPRTYIPEL